jgi:voltage-gated potassium channel Kch
MEEIPVSAFFVAIGHNPNSGIFKDYLKFNLLSRTNAKIPVPLLTITERSVEGSNIKNFADGFWWAITTVTTVGYGDRYPTTTEGRLLAVMLMFMGISLVGVITASVAAWFVKMSQDAEKQ